MFSSFNQDMKDGKDKDSPRSSAISRYTKIMHTVERDEWNTDIFIRIIEGKNDECIRTTSVDDQ